jgi:hypothetical protein
MYVMVMHTPVFVTFSQTSTRIKKHNALCRLCRGSSHDGIAMSQPMSSTAPFLSIIINIII